MKQFALTIETLSALLIVEKSGDSNMLATKDYITGTTIHGLLANLYLKAYRVSDIFYKTFFGSTLVIQNAYPFVKNKTYKPTPISFHEHKLEGNFHDLLFADDNMDETTKPIGGFSQIDGDKLEIVNVDKSINFHHITDAKTGRTSEKGGIFNYQSIDEGQFFTCVIKGADDEIDTIHKLISDSIHRIGRSKTSQYGRVRLYKSEITDCKNDSEKQTATMTLLSDTIILNDNGMSVVSCEALSKALGVNIKNSFVRKDTFENYVNVLKAKRPSENVFKAGSCFLLDKLPVNAKGLEETGIGERTYEGFGQVVFGYQEDQTIDSIVKVENESSFTLIEEKIPPLTLEILHYSLSKQMENSIIAEALEDAEGFGESRTNRSKLISNSLASRIKSFNGTGIANFINNISELEKRAPARDALLACKKNGVTLLDFLKDLKNNIDKRIDSVCNTNNSLPAKIIDGFKKGVKDEYYKLYIDTFFSHFRRMNKRNKNKQHDHDNA